MSQQTWVQSAWDQTVRKVERTSRRIGSGFPHASVYGRYDDERPSWWTAGFWPGLLWQLYRGTNQAEFRQLAEECEAKLEPVLRGYHDLHHDIGFMWSLTSVANYKMMGSEASRKTALHAAGILAGRYNPKGRFIRAWNEEPFIGWAIIDCMMNLALLYWASETSGDPRFKHIAVEHAQRVRETFIHADGSSHHIVSFDPETGEKLDGVGGQGYAADSAWSRGNAWALYGFTLSYRYTRDPQFLETAQRVADYYLANLPDDHVPYWDFKLPSTDGMPRDTSAAACAACGLLELAELTSPIRTGVYRSAGEQIVRSLTDRYGAWEQEEEGLLLSGTGNYPTKGHVNVPLIYGDYFYVEALSKLMGNHELFW